MRAHLPNNGVAFEREALHRLPGVLETLLGTPVREVFPLAHLGSGYDARIEILSREWLIAIKSASGPGTVAEVAERLARLAGDGIPLLVVPFMTQAGAKAATERALNWIDLSGNAHIRDRGLFVSVQGQPNQFASRGRPSSAFAPKSSRITRALLLDPSRWWTQKELAEHTDLDPGRVSRVVRRLHDDDLLIRQETRVRPRDAGRLLDAWADDYRFDRHDIVTGHVTGTSIELARDLHDALERADIAHAFTGLPAAWAISQFARFRLSSVYVHGDPRAAADALGMRRNDTGANVQLIGPADHGVFDGKQTVAELPCVTPVQIYLDLLALPERAQEAAEELRHSGGLWP